jgi:hypothetical protein
VEIWSHTCDLAIVVATSGQLPLFIAGRILFNQGKPAALALNSVVTVFLTSIRVTVTDLLESAEIACM